MIEPPKIFLSKEELPSGVRTIEAYDGAIEELFLVEHPQFKGRMKEAGNELARFRGSSPAGECWIFFPWRDAAVHTVDEATYFRLRTARNRNIILAEEQAAYRNIVLGIAGLSVGSGVLHALAVSGGPKRIKIADFDTIEITNLNRIRAGLLDVGSNKTEVAARALWELDPFAELSLWTSGVASDTLERFFSETPALDIFVDEMDSIDLKFKARFIARERRVPVLMATDNGDGIILDVERFDLESERPIFHGSVKEMKPEEMASLAFPEWVKLATRIVGPEHLTERMRQSLLAVGKDLPAVPQLGTTASLAGSAIAFAVRRIAAKEDLPSGRYAFGLEEKLVPGYDSAEAREERAQGAASFRKILDI